MADLSLPDAPGARAGTLLGDRYRFERLIARGGMAEVWEATDEVLARKVAVKVLHAHLAADESFVARFRREAVAAARLVHPAIVSIYDTCSSDHVEAIVMELVPGTTLRAYLEERGGTLEPSEAVGIVAQVADALEVAHRAGIVHRDVKPGNILLSNDGRVLVADFGIAKASDSGSGDLTTTGTTLGTAKYLAPEQIEGHPVDGRADVYALGVILYELVCGRPPFEGDSEAATALARLHRDPLRPRQIKASVPRPIEEVVLKALARDVERRYATAADMRAALLAASNGVTTGPVVTNGADPDATAAVAIEQPLTPTHAQPSFTSTERSWLVPAIVIVLVAAAVAGAGVLFSRTEAGRELLGRDGVSPSTGSAATIAGTAVFDPPAEGGDGQENNDELANLTDGDPATTWSTVGYNTRALGGLKEGVGFVVSLSEAAGLKALAVVSPTTGWAARVYVADQAGASLAEWGEPVDDKQGIGGDVTFDLKGRSGRFVLVWITDLGDGPADPRVNAEIAEVQVRV